MREEAARAVREAFMRYARPYLRPFSLLRLSRSAAQAQARRRRGGARRFFSRPFTFAVFFFAPRLFLPPFRKAWQLGRGLIRDTRAVILSLHIVTVRSTLRFTFTR